MANIFLLQKYSDLFNYLRMLQFVLSGLGILITVNPTNAGLWSMARDKPLPILSLAASGDAR